MILSYRVYYLLDNPDDKLEGRIGPRLLRKGGGEPLPWQGRDPVLTESTRRPLPHSIGASDAETCRDERLDRAEDGKVIAITRPGQPIARLVPNDDSVHRTRARLMVFGEQNGPRLPEGASFELLIGEVRE